MNYFMLLFLNFKIEEMPQLTSVLNRTTIMVLVIIVALTGSVVTPENVNCINKKERNSVATPS